MKKGNKKKLIIAIVILILLIIYLFVTIQYLKNSSKNSIKTPEEMSSVEKLLKLYDCTDIKIEQASDGVLSKYIYLTFGEDLLKEGNPNEGYFGGIVSNVAKILDYENFRLIDSSRELTIDVICNMENQKIDAIYINGELNYFQKLQTKAKAEKGYEEIEPTSFTINSQEIKKLINADWKANEVEFGTVESRFNDYDIYFDEGIEVKTIGGKVYNIIFTEKYKGNIINGINVITQENAKSNIGTPQFESNNVYGYKGDKIYVFFSQNEISVYRVEDDYNQEEFLKVWQEFNETKDAKQFTEKITQCWPDFDSYIAYSKTIEIQYSLKGIQIVFNSNGENGLALYNNFKGELQDGLTLKKITKDSLPQFVYLHTEKDLVFTDEEKRVFGKQNLYNEDYIAMMEYDSNIENRINGEDGNRFEFTDTKSQDFNMIFSYVREDTVYGIQFISKNRQYPNSELIRHKEIYRYGWLNNDYFVYSVKNQGIYCYNPKKLKTTTIVEGTDEFYIKKINGTKLFYDDKQIDLT